ncbi:ASKHA domain-containing protein [Syntrophomonas palmitatica]|uniref:ASKHA domain-containing protein n=1 Tax=Syntrophomonas palmitatica TaxID=402877 RepID=UPI0012ED6DB9|nr:ASKHA domain-containing protein [Syntrophomonas palmitatica]
MSNEIKIDIIDSGGHTFSCWSDRGRRLWDIIAANGLETGGTCGGKGTCGKCKLKVEGQIEPPGEAERRHLLPEELKAGERLACYCSVQNEIKVQLYSLDQDRKTRVFFKPGEEYPLDHSIEIRRIFIPGMDREQPLPVLSRLADALPSCALELSLDNISFLAAIDRAGRPALELYALVVEGRKVTRVMRRPEKILGIALDLGSTSLFAAVLDMLSGETLHVASRSNMQRVYGADIISRVSYCMENENGLHELQQVLINNVNSMIAEMLAQIGSSADSIYRYTVVGNPVMLHLFAEINVAGFAHAPYCGVFRDHLTFPASAPGLLGGQAEVFILPQVGGFVGADTVAGLLSLDINKTASYLFIDIGTNGEIVLNHRDKMWAASAAAGPALEGGNITCGMRAGEGAIDRCWLREEGELVFNVLGNAAVRGICGSGLIDLTACLLKAGYIDARGTINPSASENLSVIRSENGPSIVLSQELNPVVLTQDDIRQVQLAKSALRTAIDVLLREAGINHRDLDCIILAGTFGTYLDPENCMTIGLLPQVDKKKIINAGNTAARGAAAALLSERKRCEATAIRDKIQYVELASYPGFQDLFIQHLDFTLTNNP